MLHVYVAKLRCNELGYHALNFKIYLLQVFKLLFYPKGERILLEPIECARLASLKLIERQKRHSRSRALYFHKLAENFFFIFFQFAQPCINLIT